MEDFIIELKKRIDRAETMLNKKVYDARDIIADMYSFLEEYDFYPET